MCHTVHKMCRLRVRASVRVCVYARACMHAHARAALYVSQYHESLGRCTRVRGQPTAAEVMNQHTATVTGRPLSSKDYKC